MSGFDPRWQMVMATFHQFTPDSCKIEITASVGAVAVPLAGGTSYRPGATWWTVVLHDHGRLGGLSIARWEVSTEDDAMELVLRIAEAYPHVHEVAVPRLRPGRLLMGNMTRRPWRGYARALA